MIWGIFDLGREAGSGHFYCAIITGSHHFQLRGKLSRGTEPFRRLGIHHGIGSGIVSGIVLYCYVYTRSYLRDGLTLESTVHTKGVASLWRSRLVRLCSLVEVVQSCLHLEVLLLLELLQAHVGRVRQGEGSRLGLVQQPRGRLHRAGGEDGQGAGRGEEALGGLGFLERVRRRREGEKEEGEREEGRKGEREKRE